MITYNPAFDLYHAIFRMAHILQRLDEGETMEVEKVRIWDFYLLFPDKVHKIKIRRDETDFQTYRKQLKEKGNPYEYQGDNRQLFEWIKPFQVSALNCLVSCGILSKDEYLAGRVFIADRAVLKAYLLQAGTLSRREHNALSFMNLLSRQMPLTGPDGLKERTRLLEFKYDAK